MNIGAERGTQVEHVATAGSSNCELRSADLDRTFLDLVSELQARLKDIQQATR